MEYIYVDTSSLHVLTKLGVSFDQFAKSLNGLKAAAQEAAKSFNNFGVVYGQSVIKEHQKSNYCDRIREQFRDFYNEYF